MEALEALGEVGRVAAALEVQEEARQTVAVPGVLAVERAVGDSGAKMIRLQD